MKGHSNITWNNISTLLAKSELDQISIRTLLIFCGICMRLGSNFSFLIMKLVGKYIFHEKICTKFAIIFQINFSMCISIISQTQITAGHFLMFTIYISSNYIRSFWMNPCFFKYLNKLPSFPFNVLNHRMANGWRRFSKKVMIRKHM